MKAPAKPKVTMLGVPGECAATLRGDTLIITTPLLGPDEAPCRHAYAFRIEGASVVP